MVPRRTLKKLAEQHGTPLFVVDHDEIRWVEPAGLDESAFTEPDRPVVRLLKAGAAGAGERSV